MNTKLFFRITAAVISLLTVFSCTKEIDEPIDQPTEPETYTLSIKASKGEFTKGLSLDENTLNAIWDGSEEVYVFKGDQQIGVLSPVIETLVYPAKVSCTLAGPFTTLPVDGDELTLKLTSNNYSEQDGTLDFIASHCDYAVATLHVTGVNNGQIESIEGTAAFENQQAIVKFTLKDKVDGTTLLSPTTLTVNDGTSDIATATIPASTYTTNGSGVLYVAIPPVAGKTLTLTATVGEDTYSYTRFPVTFAQGQYYTISVKMIKQRTVDLSTKTGNYEAQDGDILTGTLGSNYRLTIADGATVTLNGVTHNAGTFIDGICCLGSATIILAPGSVNDLTYGDVDSYCGIYCELRYTLTIEGTGTLNASGAANCPGIGGLGKIIINGGIITATGGDQRGAGIGSISDDNLGYNSITINGGDITAIGGSDGGAGIGTGRKSNGGDITITGGTIKATGGMDAAGIGCGYNSYGVGKITITDGVTSLTTIKGGFYASCIGLGYESTDNKVISIDGIEFTIPQEIDNEISSLSFKHFNFYISTTSETNDTWVFTHK